MEIRLVSSWLWMGGLGQVDWWKEDIFTMETADMNGCIQRLQRRNNHQHHWQPLQPLHHHSKQPPFSATAAAAGSVVQSAVLSRTGIVASTAAHTMQSTALSATSISPATLTNTAATPMSAVASSMQIYHNSAVTTAQQRPTSAVHRYQYFHCILQQVIKQPIQWQKSLTEEGTGAHASTTSPTHPNFCVLTPAASPCHAHRSKRFSCSIRN